MNRRQRFGFFALWKQREPTLRAGGKAQEGGARRRALAKARVPMRGVPRGDGDPSPTQGPPPGHPPLTSESQGKLCAVLDHAGQGDLQSSPHRGLEEGCRGSAGFGRSCFLGEAASFWVAGKIAFAHHPTRFLARATDQVAMWRRVFFRQRALAQDVPGTQDGAR